MGLVSVLCYLFNIRKSGDLMLCKYKIYLVVSIYGVLGVFLSNHVSSMFEGNVIPEHFVLIYISTIFMSLGFVGVTIVLCKELYQINKKYFLIFLVVFWLTSLVAAISEEILIGYVILTYPFLLLAYVMRSRVKGVGDKIE